MRLMEATKPKESTEITKSKETTEPKEPSELEESKETTETKETTESNETTESKVESNETTESSDANASTTTSSPWQTIWDNNTQMYYYWNMVTNETSWEIPVDKSYWDWQYNNDNTEINNNETTNENEDDSNESNNNNNNDLTTNNNNSSTTEVSTATTTTTTTDNTATASATTEGGEYTSQEYYQYYYSQYGYYPEGYYYGYDSSAYPSNEVTETSTEDSSNPLESLLDKIDTEVKSKLDGKPASSSIASYPRSAGSSFTYDGTYERESSSQVDGAEDSDYYSFLAQHGDNGGDYKLTARFNARTGKFQRDPNLTPEKFSAESKAFRQMSYFFDYDKFAEQRSKKVKLDESAEIKTKKLNKKDVEFFKQKKKEKKEMKKKAWLMGGE